MTEVTSPENRILIDLAQNYSLLDTIQNGIQICDKNIRIIYTNPAFSKITEYAAEEALDQSPAILHSGRHDKAFYKSMWNSINSKGYWEGEIWNRKKSGRIYPEFLTITKMMTLVEDEYYYIAIFSDITFLKKDIEHNMHLAYYDALTELPNRLLYMNRLNEAIKLARSSETKIKPVIFFMDLDKFKYVNDTYGHITGDELLKLVGQRLSSIIRPGDTVARMGGDEFAVLITSTNDKADIIKLAKRIIDSIDMPFVIEGQTMSVSISIGVNFYNTESNTDKSLIDGADKAMYTAKKNRSQICLYEEIA